MNTNFKTKKKALKTPKFNPEMFKGMQRPPIFGNIFFYIFTLFAIYLVLSFAAGLSGNYKSVPLSEVLDKINNSQVQNVLVAEDKIEVLLKDGSKLVTEKESSISFDDTLKNSNISINKIAGEYKVEHRLTFDQILTPLVMIGFPLLLLFFLLRQMKGSGGDIMSFGRSRAKLFNKSTSKVTFEDIAGNEEAKREMKEIVDFLKNPQKYKKIGARIPKGVLLVGSSGVGKTLLAKAIAGEAGAPFFSVAGSEFMEMLVGVGSSRVRDLFRMAREAQPSLIFIDEIDAIGRQRGMGIGGGHDEREQTLNQILIEMDGFDPRTDVIVLAATNRPDMLDPALVRPGRFDRRISIPMPDLEARKEIIQIHMKGKPMNADVSVERIARKTVGFSGADLENMINESAILAAREDRDTITQKDLDEASLKVTLGSERKTLQTEEEKRMTAYHESGHALVASLLPDMDPVNRISIVARGGSLGHTSYDPLRDRYNETKTRLLSIISSMLGGRAAEEVVFNEQTIGAVDDIERASKLARKMVTEYGMSALGPIAYQIREASHWLAREMGESVNVSPEMAAKIDSEIALIMEGCYNQAKKILLDNKELLDKISTRLLEVETIDTDEFKELVG